MQIQSLSIQGEFFKLLRDEAKSSQVAFANWLGISQAQLSLLESGKRNARITPQFLSRINNAPYRRFLVALGVGELKKNMAVAINSGRLNFGLLPKSLIDKYQDEIINVIGNDIQTKWFADYCTDIACPIDNPPQ